MIWEREIRRGVKKSVSSSKMKMRGVGSAARSSFSYARAALLLITWNLVCLEQASAQRLFFSKYVHADEARQLVEIYNPSCMEAPLNEFSIIVAKDGGAWNYGSQFFLARDPAMKLGGGGTWVIASDDFKTNYLPPITNRQLEPTYVDKYLSSSRIYQKEGGTYYGWFNGNDALALLHNGIIIDTIGKEKMPAMKTAGTGFNINGDPLATKNKWLARKSWVMEGNMGRWKERGHKSNASEWSVYPAPSSSVDALLLTVGTHKTDTGKFPCSLDKLTCAATGYTLGVSRGESTFVCPPNCHLYPGKVIGQGGTYDIGSSICKAAIHANITQLVNTPGFPQEGRPQPYSDAHGISEVNDGNNAPSDDQIPAKKEEESVWVKIGRGIDSADIIILAPNGNDAFFNFSDGASMSDSSWNKLQTHLRTLVRQFMFYNNDQMTRMAIAGYSNAIIPAQPKWRNTYSAIYSDIAHAIEYNSGTSGEKVGDALRLTCDALLKYDVRNDSLSQGFEILTIGNSTTGWGKSYDNPIATSRDAHYMFDWKEPYSNGFGSEGIFQFILRNIWDAQLCWDRSYQTSQERPYIKYQAKEIPYEAMISKRSQCVASYNRTHKTAAPTVSPTQAPTRNPTQSPTTVSPTIIACVDCTWDTDIRQEVTVPVVVVDPITQPVEEPLPSFDAFTLTRDVEYKMLCFGGRSCNNNGNCIHTEGYCQCYNGFSGPGCAEIAQWTQRATYTWEMIASKSIANLSKAPESGALDAVHATLTQVSALVTRDSSDDIASNFYVDLIWTTIAMVVAFVTIPAESANVIKGGFHGKFCQYAKCTDDCSDFGICDVETGHCSCDHATWLELKEEKESGRRGSITIIYGLASMARMEVVVVSDTVLMTAQATGSATTYFGRVSATKAGASATVLDLLQFTGRRNNDDDDDDDRYRMAAHAIRDEVMKSCAFNEFEEEWSNDSLRAVHLKNLGFLPSSSITGIKLKLPSVATSWMRAICGVGNLGKFMLSRGQCTEEDATCDACGILKDMDHLLQCPTHGREQIRLRNQMRAIMNRNDDTNRLTKAEIESRTAARSARQHRSHEDAFKCMKHIVAETNRCNISAVAAALHSYIRMTIEKI
eukprot:jgi/Bigna1/79389/fgenesh1_pg.62_\